MAYVFERLVNMKIRLRDAWDIRNTGLGVIELIGDDASIEIPAYRGKPGLAGRDGTPPQLHEVDTAGDIPDESELTSDWIGHGWHVAGTRDVTFCTTDPDDDNALRLTTALDWLGTRGEPGPAAEFSVGSVTTSDDVSNVQVEQVEEGAHALHFTLRRGRQGKQGNRGPAAAIRAAADYQEDEAPTDGEVPTWDGSTEMWQPRIPRSALGPYTIPSSSFSNAHTPPLSSDTKKLIASKTIPAQPFDWHPMVSGHVPASSGLTAKAGIDVFMGQDESSAVLVGRGLSQASIQTYAIAIAPHFEQEVDPDSPHARTEAGVQTSIWVYAVRTNSSIDEWNTFKDGAHLALQVMPAGSTIAGPPAAEIGNVIDGGDATA